MCRCDRTRSTSIVEIKRIYFMPIIIIKKEKSWIGSIKCEENHNFSYIKRRCRVYLIESLLTLPYLTHAFFFRLGVCVYVCMYRTLCIFLEVHTDRCQSFYFFFSSISYVSYVFVRTHYFELLVILFAWYSFRVYYYYHPVVLSLM